MYESLLVSYLAQVLYRSLTAFNHDEKDKDKTSTYTGIRKENTGM